MRLVQFATSVLVAILLGGFSSPARALPAIDPNEPVITGYNLLHAFMGRADELLDNQGSPDAKADGAGPQQLVELDATAAPTKSCGKKADVALIIDSSGSVDTTEWELQADFMRAIVKGMGVGEKKVEYGISVFAERGKTLLALTSDDSKVDTLPFASSGSGNSGCKSADRGSWNIGCATNMAPAFSLANTMLSGSTRPVPKITLMLCDGRPSDKAKAEAEAAKLKAKPGYVVMAILIGSGIKEDQVKNMVTVPALLAPSFNSLPSVLAAVNQQLANAICEAEKSLPPSTPEPSVTPTTSPTRPPTAEPTRQPPAQPTRPPTAEPTRPPTAEPTEPTAPPLTPVPSHAPTAEPTEPTAPPLTPQPTPAPTGEPTEPTAPPIPLCKAKECYCVSAGGDTCDGSTCVKDQCTDTNFCNGGGYWCFGTKPTATPTKTPTKATARPTVLPSVLPTAPPTIVPTATPTAVPSFAPSTLPTAVPTMAPTVAKDLDTLTPTVAPSSAPSANPTVTPSSAPSANPTTAPTMDPTEVPTLFPTAEPTAAPSFAPVDPTEDPTPAPTAETPAPIAETAAPISTPAPTDAKSKPTSPTAVPSFVPSDASTPVPTLTPSAAADLNTLTPSLDPSHAPTALPTVAPTVAPTVPPVVQLELKLTNMTSQKFEQVQPKLVQSLADILAISADRITLVLESTTSSPLARAAALLLEVDEATVIVTIRSAVKGSAEKTAEEAQATLNRVGSAELTRAIAKDVPDTEVVSLKAYASNPTVAPTSGACTAMPMWTAPLLLAISLLILHKQTY